MVLMLIVNMNIRGLGGSTKARYLRQIIACEGVSLYACKKQSQRSSWKLSVLLCGGTTRLVGFIMKELMEVVVCYLCGIKKPLAIVDM